MPVFEYQCRQCGHTFEMLIMGATQPVCPACQSHHLEKMFSVCAINAHPSGQLGPDTRGKHVRPFEPGPVCPVTERE